MIDYFALLQQPRRPWLDPEQLKQKHQQLTLTAHPDRQGSNEPALDFAVVNEAYRVLSDPKLRLQHLLSLQGHDPGAQVTPYELTELFAKTGTFVQDTDSLIEKLRATKSALSKSLLRPEVLEAQKRAGDILDQLQKLYTNALDELKRLDASWNESAGESIEDLTKLYRRFAYLGRWMDQVRERQFQLSI